MGQARSRPSRRHEPRCRPRTGSGRCVHRPSLQASAEEGRRGFRALRSGRWDRLRAAGVRVLGLRNLGKPWRTLNAARAPPPSWSKRALYRADRHGASAFSARVRRRPRGEHRQRRRQHRNRRSPRSARRRRFASLRLSPPARHARCRAEPHARPVIARGSRADGAARCRVGHRAGSGAPASSQQPMHRDPRCRSVATTAWPRGRLPIPFPDIVAGRRFRMDRAGARKEMHTCRIWDACRSLATPGHDWLRPVPLRRHKFSGEPLGKPWAQLATTAYCVVMRFKHIPRFQGVGGCRRGSPENRGRTTAPAGCRTHPRRCTRSLQTFPRPPRRPLAAPGHARAAPSPCGRHWLPLSGFTGFGDRDECAL